jgi:hypothetical protein
MSTDSIRYLANWFSMMSLTAKIPSITLKPHWNVASIQVHGDGAYVTSQNVCPSETRESYDSGPKPSCHVFWWVKLDSVFTNFNEQRLNI